VLRTALNHRRVVDEQLHAYRRPGDGDVECTVRRCFSARSIAALIS
jgi:hypothetical protein